MAEQSGLIEAGLVLGERSDGRRIFSLAAKRALVKACQQPGVSVAHVAQLHALNANLLHKWIRLHADDSIAVAPLREVALLPVAPSEAQPATADSKPVLPQSEPCIEIMLGAATIRLHGAVDVRQLRQVLDCVSRA